MGGKALAWLERQGEHAKFRDSIQVGDIVTRNQDGVLVNLSQLKRVAKPADKVEPKFHEEDWVVTSYGKVNQVVSVDKDGDGYTLDDGVYFSGSWCDMYHLWTIQDAKDGDLIYVSTEEKEIQAIFHEYKNQTIFFYCYLCGDFVQGGYMPIGDVELVYPLQETHYKRFFEKMHDAGYEWDAEKKELKKIEQKPLWSEEDEKMLAQVINEIEAIKSNSSTVFEKNIAQDKIDWLKSLKDRVQPQHEQADEHLSVVRTKELIRAEIQKQKQNLIDSIGRISNKELNLAHHILCVLESFINTIPEKSIEWTEDDENKVTLFMQLVEGCDNYEELSNWLKSLRPHNMWKPSDEQMYILNWVANILLNHDGVVEEEASKKLQSLYNDLKKLKG